ncbi:hypothetical protein [Sphingomonas sp. 3-13AW]|uniref:hypothetical protein n=1 Tax=Sphingomonas sp. 3-13AW TaxID=3050450 RepID=UPI003BB6E7DB
MRTFNIVALYALSFAFLWAGVELGPQAGWPKTGLEIQGCALLILGLILKSTGHWQLLARM